MFKLNKFIPQFFFSPDDGLGGGGLDTFDALFSEVEEQASKDEVEPEVIIPDSTDDEEPEVTEEDPKEDKEEEIEINDEVKFQTVPKRKEILEQFPELFKKFPAVEAAIYRDKQFTEIFPTPEDAREALQASESFSNLHKEVMSGNTTNLLGGIKDEDPEAFKNVIDNLLPNLHEVDKEAYYHTIGSVAQMFIARMVQIGKSRDNEAVAAAAQILNQVVFGTDEFVPQQKLAKQIAQDDDVKQQRENFQRERFESVVNDLTRSTDNLLKKGLMASVDPQNGLTDYVREIAVSKVFNEIEKTIQADKAFKAVLNSMWRKVVQSNFDQSLVDKIKAAYLSKAKSIAPPIIKKHRAEAYKGMGRVSRTNKDRQGLVKPGRSASPNNSGKSTNVKELAAKIPAGMSSADFLLADD